MRKRVISFIVICLWMYFAANSLAATWMDQGEISQVKSTPKAKKSHEQPDLQFEIGEAPGELLAAMEDGQEVSVTIGIEGIEVGIEVLAVSGLGAETEVIDFREATNRFVHKLPGTTSAQTLVLSIPGATLPREIRNWISDTQAGGPTKRIVTVTFHGRRGLTHWNLAGCFPSGLSISGPNLPGPVVTTLTIACDRLAFTE